MKPVVWKHWTVAKAPSVEWVGSDLAAAAQALPDWHIKLKSAPSSHKCGCVESHFLRVYGVVCVCARVCKAGVCARVCMCMCARTHLQVRVHAYVQACVRACMCTCVCVMLQELACRRGMALEEPLWHMSL